MKFDQSDIKRGYPRFRLFSYRNDRFVSREPLNALMIQLEIVTSTENRSLEWHVIYEIASFQNNSNVSRSRDRCSIMNFHRRYHWRSSHSWKRAKPVGKPLKIHYSALANELFLPVRSYLSTSAVQ